MNNYKKALELLNDADAILITAGAGMGVDSGLPDFRGDEGLWRAYPPLKAAGYSFTDVESGYLFRKRPHLAWGFYGHRMELYKNTSPHEGFVLLYDFVKKKNNNYFILTSNVDAHFQKAGFDREKIYEVHGSVEYLQCIDNCNDRVFPNKLEKIDVDMETLLSTSVPYCQECQEVMTPNILFFGGTVFNEKRVKEQNGRFIEWLKSVADKKVAIIEIGAGTTVPTIRNFNDNYTQRYKNFTLIRINPGESEVSDGNISIKERGLDALEKILQI